MQKTSKDHPKDHRYTLVFAVMLLCAAGAFTIAFFGPDPLTTVQQKVFEMMSFGWMTSVTALIGLRVTDRQQDRQQP